ncbi:HlyD family secretion protein [Saccharicrinis aurantiacus]|uniref:HlyD family secretion protein n=1 Tax=Saccharicrinis aurantiacus TaxID=1849719 RepID=UPI000838B4F8|nr:biotin/lipoyl-binding protein [Saccharicrinis aurantiacus]
MKTIIKIQILSVLALLSSCAPKTIEGEQGKIKRDALMVVSKYPGRIIEIYANEGDKVNKGDTLFLLDMPEVEAKMNQAQGAVNAAEGQYKMALKGATNEQLEQIMAKLDAVTEQYKFAEKSYNRINNMFKDSMVSVQKHDEVYMKYQGAKAQYVGVKAKYEEVKNGVRDEKIQMALGTLERAKGALEEANVAYSERFLVAPQAMTIETIALHPGELVLPGYGVANGYELSKAYFRFTVTEHNIAKYKVGDKVDIESPFTNESYKAKIVSVKQLTRYANITSAFPEYELGESIYEVKAVPAAGTNVNNMITNITVLLK